MNWFVLKDSKAHGPYTVAQLSAAAKAGKLQAQDKVSMSSNGPWSAASSIPELGAYFPLEGQSSPPTIPSPSRQATKTQPKAQSRAEQKPKMLSSKWALPTIAGLWLASLLMTILLCYFLFKSPSQTLAQQTPSKADVPSEAKKNTDSPPAESALPSEPASKKTETTPPNAASTEPFSIKGIRFGMTFLEVIAGQSHLKTPLTAANYGFEGFY